MGFGYARARGLSSRKDTVSGIRKYAFRTEASANYLQIFRIPLCPPGPRR